MAKKWIKDREKTEGYKEKYKPGLNILFHCQEECNKRQIVNHGQGIFNIFQIIFDGFRCPECSQEIFEMETLILANCHYKVVTIKLKDNNKDNNRANTEYCVDEGDAKEENFFHKNFYKGFKYNSMTVYSNELGSYHTSSAPTIKF